MAFAMVCGIRVAHSLDYPTTFTFVEVPDPLSGINPTYPLTAMPLPAIGVSFFDPHFGTVLTRVTETDGYNSRHEYSRFDPFNWDQSMIVLLTEEGHWNVYLTQSMPYNQAGNLVRSVDVAEPRWDPIDANLLWGLIDFQIVTVNVQTGTQTIVKDFSQDPVMGPIIASSPVYRITTQEEGEASRDMRFWAFILQGDDRVEYEPLYIFTWDRQLDQVPGYHAIAPNDRSLDTVGMSILGNYVLIGADPWNTGTLVGFTMANRELTRFHRLAFGTAHSDTALDRDGREVVVMQNTRTDHIDLIPLDWTTSPILESEGSYAGTHIVPLILLYYDETSSHGLRSGIHVSCNFPGYAVISTYIPSGVQEQNWFDRTIVLVELNRTNPRVFYLAKLHNTSQEEPVRAYWEETHATITQDGNKVVWASNWGLSVGQEQMFLMQLDMPPNWAPARTHTMRWALYR